MLNDWWQLLWRIINLHNFTREEFPCDGSLTHAHLHWANSLVAEVLAGALVTIAGEYGFPVYLDSIEMVTWWTIRLSLPRRERRTTVAQSIMRQSSRNTSQGGTRLPVEHSWQFWLPVTIPRTPTSLCQCHDTTVRRADVLPPAPATRRRRRATAVRRRRRRAAGLMATVGPLPSLWRHRRHYRDDPGNRFSELAGNGLPPHATPVSMTTQRLATCRSQLVRATTTKSHASRVKSRVDRDLGTRYRHGDNQDLSIVAAVQSLTVVL